MKVEGEQQIIASAATVNNALGRAGSLPATAITSR